MQEQTLFSVLSDKQLNLFSLNLYKYWNSEL